MRLERVNSHVELVVSDTGVGIPPDFLPYVFERFRQADAGTTRKTGGLGLGLAIVRHLVEMHGGTVDATSAGEGKGATFRVRLPLMIVHPRDARGARASIRATDRARSARPDSTTSPACACWPSTTRRMRSSCCAWCWSGRRRGVDVRVAGRRRWSASPTMQPDVLVVDVGMPEMDGFD